MDSSIDRKRPSPDHAPDTSRGKSISPPPKRRALPSASTAIEDIGRALIADHKDEHFEESPLKPNHRPSKIVPSPIQLNFIQELPASSNLDTVSLGNILGEPMIKECWLFNYLVDVDFVMKHFDPDTRNIVQVKVVHGSWKSEDPNKIAIDEAAHRYPNVKVLRAYMPEMFGTHHSKMIVVFRHDDLAQIIILTANFIDRDWRMSQAIWRTPLLPLQQQESGLESLPPLGSGPRFKHDLLGYFRGYNQNGRDLLEDLVDKLMRHDFSEVRGALVASVPKKQILQSLDPEVENIWGWPGLKRILRCLPTKSADDLDLEYQPQIVAQISSVAAVGEKWLKSTLIPTLSTMGSRKLPPNQAKKPTISIIFPTADEIRRSIDGYGSGGSIHMKSSSNSAQVKQLTALRPTLCHWAGDQAVATTSAAHQAPLREAGRRRAAPHIKTYIRFSHDSMDKIDWAMMTSANISTQAWGAATSAGGEVRVCSYEIGVVVWPELWGDDAEMVPTFRSDTPPERKEGSEAKTVVGWRMPYDLPLMPYEADEMPWCASEACNEPDWMGRVWPGYGA